MKVVEGENGGQSFKAHHTVLSRKEGIVFRNSSKSFYL